ncbi:MAG: hypothetical protein Q8O95_00075 [bacterium]|nr:hypothetical protein [bacterium]
MEEQSNLQEINQKLDKLLAYQKREQIWRWIRGVTSLILFILFVAIPVYYSYKLIKDPSILLQYIDLSKFSSLTDQIGGLFKNFPSQ